MSIHQIDKRMVKGNKSSVKNTMAAVIYPGEVLLTGPCHNSIYWEHQAVIIADNITYCNGQYKCTKLRQVVANVPDWCQCYIKPNRMAARLATRICSYKVSVKGGIAPIVPEGMVAIPLGLSGTGCSWAVIPDDYIPMIQEYDESKDIVIISHRSLL